MLVTRPPQPPHHHTTTPPPPHHHHTTTTTPNATPHDLLLRPPGSPRGGSGLSFDEASRALGYHHKRPQDGRLPDKGDSLGNCFRAQFNYCVQHLGCRAVRSQLRHHFWRISPTYSCLVPFPCMLGTIPSRISQLNTTSTTHPRAYPILSGAGNSMLPPIFSFFLNFGPNFLAFFLAVFHPGGAMHMHRLGGHDSSIHGCRMLIGAQSDVVADSAVMMPSRNPRLPRI